MKSTLFLSAAVLALTLCSAPVAAMDVKVYVQQPSGDITDVTFEGVDAVVYEKANENTGKPDVLAVLDQAAPTDWSGYKVVGEFHADDVVGWADVSHLPARGPPTTD